MILQRDEPEIRLGGEGKIVEIDESKFGKRKYNRGKHVEGTWIFGGIERDSNGMFMVTVNNRKSETLIPIIRKYIKPGTTIFSDYWKAYDCLPEYGYIHGKVNHSKEFKSAVGVCTNRIESTWRAMKASLPRYGTTTTRISRSTWFVRTIWRM